MNDNVVSFIVLLFIFWYKMFEKKRAFQHTKYKYINMRNERVYKK